MIADEVEVVFRANTNAYIANVTKAESVFSAKLQAMQDEAQKAGAALSPIGAQAAKSFDQVSKGAVAAAKSIHSQATANLALAKASGTATAEHIKALGVAQQQAAASLAVARADRDRAAAATAAANASTKGFAGIASNAPRASTAIRGVSGSFDRLQQNTGNVAAQIQDIGVQLAGGQSPFIIMAQQIPQLTAATGSLSGVMGGLARSFSQILSPVGLVSAGLILAASVAASYFSDLLGGADDSEEALKREADLIQRIADRWGEAAPALKKYADEIKKLKDVSEFQEATNIAIAAVFEDARKEVDRLDIDLIDLIGTLDLIGEKPEKIRAIQEAFAALKKAVDEGRDSTKENKDLQTALADTFSAESVPAVGKFVDALQGLADKFSTAAQEAKNFRTEAMRALSPDIYGDANQGFYPTLNLPDKAPTPNQLGPDDFYSGRKYEAWQIIGKTKEGRSIVVNPDGGLSTELVETVDDPRGAGYINVPTLFEGRPVSIEEAVDKIIAAGYKDPETGRAIQNFRTIAAAEASARARSESLGSDPNFAAAEREFSSSNQRFADSLSFLKSRAVSDKIADRVEGLDDNLAEALAKLFAQFPNVKIVSAVRTREEQQAIYDSGVRPAARPGTSRHERGGAVDLRIPPEDIKAFAEAAAQVGLENLARIGDPGHYQLAGQRDTGGGAGREPKKTPAQLFEGDIAQVQKRIDLLNAEIEATAGLSKGVEDYGYAVEKAKIKAELLNEAKAKDLAITPGLMERIDQLAGNYAKLSAAKQQNIEADRQLKKSQEELARSQEEFANFSKDVLGGFINDLVAGKSAAEALAGALEKIGQKLLDIALDQLFAPTAGGGGGFGGFLASIFGGFKAAGGPVSAGRAYVVGEKRPELFVPNTSGKIIPRVPDMAAMRQGGQNVGGVVHARSVVEVINGNVVPVMMEISGRMGAAQIKQSNKTMAARLQQTQARGTS